MTNELGEYPSVCNKSIQAQSTDIQAPIPESVLTHPLADFRELDGHELEHLGRLGDPLHKDRQSDHPVVVRLPGGRLGLGAGSRRRPASGHRAEPDVLLFLRSLVQ